MFSISTKGELNSTDPPLTAVAVDNFDDHQSTMLLFIFCYIIETPYIFYFWNPCDQGSAINCFQDVLSPSE